MLTQFQWLAIAIVFGLLALSTLIAGIVMVNNKETDDSKKKEKKNTGIALLVVFAVSTLIAGGCYYKSRQNTIVAVDYVAVPHE